MSYETIIAKIREIIEAANAALGEGTDGVKVEEFLAELRRIGGNTVPALKEASWEDLKACGLPQLLAKQVAHAIREHTADEAKPARRITPNNVADATDEDLVGVYDPDKATSPAADELRKRAKNAPFVVFDPNSGGVHRKATLELFREIVAGHEAREFYAIGGLPQKVYRVGERPPRMADEHPLFVGVALRPDGTDRFALQWTAEGLTLPKRQLARLAVQSGELKFTDSVDGVSDVHRRLCELSEEALHQRYPKASQRFQQLREQSQLPTLRVPIGEHACGIAGRQDPLRRTGGGHRMD